MLLLLLLVPLLRVVALMTGDAVVVVVWALADVPPTASLTAVYALLYIARALLCLPGSVDVPYKHVRVRAIGLLSAALAGNGGKVGVTLLMQKGTES